MTRALRLIATIAAFALAAATLVAVSSREQEPAAPEGWRLFAGSWSSTGTRQTLPTEGGSVAAVVQLSGAVVLSRDSGLSIGFRGEAIGFDDGQGTVTGRAVWTDARGDQVFSVLRGEPIDTGRRIVGTLTGGTGRYTGITGDYELTWQYVVRDEDTVAGRAVDLRGRFRPGDSRR